MARKNGTTPDDMEFSSESGSARSEVGDYSGREFDDGEAFDAARLMDPEPDEDAPFLRGRKRIPARRGPLPKKTAKWLKTALLGVAVTCVAAAAFWSVRHYALKAPRFSTPSSSDAVEITGNKNATREEILSVFGEDILRNVFRVPLEERKRKLEEIPWIESATIMRYLPNRLAVVVRERTPVAQVLVGSQPALIDASGVVMPTPDGAKYSFPVLTGFSEIDPISTRRARVAIYLALVRELDSENKGYSQDLDTVDITNPEDIKITTLNASALIHVEKKKFPQEDRFMQQYNKYLEVLPQCRARFGTAAIEIDTRFEGQTPCRLVDGEPSGVVGEVPSGTTETLQPKDSATKVKGVRAVETPVIRPVSPKQRSRWRPRKH